MDFMNGLSAEASQFQVGDKVTFINDTQNSDYHWAEADNPNPSHILAGATGTVKTIETQGVGGITVTLDNGGEVYVFENELSKSATKKQAEVKAPHHVMFEAFSAANESVRGAVDGGACGFGWAEVYPGDTEQSKAIYNELKQHPQSTESSGDYLYISGRTGVQSIDVNEKWAKVFSEYINANGGVSSYSSRMD